MTFGLRVSNDSNYIQIDSELPRLCAVYSGTYAASGHYGIEVVFPSPISTAEPPCIFIQNSPAQPGVLYSAMVIRGAPGAWTGFYLESGNVTWRPQGKWFAAVFASISAATWGLRMWDGSGNVIYDSGATPIIFTKSTNSWAYVGTIQLAIGNAYYYRAATTGPMASDEYFMINPFSRGTLAPQQTSWNPSGVQFDYSDNSLFMYSIGFTGWIDPGAPGAVFARLPGT